MLSGSGLIAVGRVLRNAAKVRMLGFAAKKGVGFVIEAEFRAIFERLNIAWDASFRKVVIECDSSTAVSLISRSIGVNHPYFSIDGDWSCVVSLIYREGNKVVDGLASLGHSMDLGTFFLGPPHVLFSLLLMTLRV
ncbi:hypothetical protein ACOSQ3_010601 [Xanthoceras sorbifolium]